jgi:hypothetical protein
MAWSGVAQVVRSEMKSKAAARQVQQSMQRMRGATTSLWDTIDGALRLHRKPHQAHDYKKRAIDALIARDGRIQASHFEVLQHLGQGDVGNVQVYTPVTLGCSRVGFISLRPTR